MDKELIRDHRDRLKAVHTKVVDMLGMNNVMLHGMDGIEVNEAFKRRFDLRKLEAVGILDSIGDYCDES